MTLFARVFRNKNITLRLWDLFFIEGAPVLFQAAIAILRILAETQSTMWLEMEEVIPTL